MVADPEFPGGEKAWKNFLATHLHYPIDAREKNLQALVYVTFVVDKDGSVTNIKVAKPKGNGFDEAAVKALKSSPRWIPGATFGIPFRKQFTIPISFSLYDTDYRVNGIAPY
ncbi:MAG: energy transducer TonB [Mucilaginibacter sp.]